MKDCITQPSPVTQRCPRQGTALTERCPGQHTVKSLKSGASSTQIIKLRLCSLYCVHLRTYFNMCIMWFRFMKPQIALLYPSNYLYLSTKSCPVFVSFTITMGKKPALLSFDPDRVRQYVIHC